MNATLPLPLPDFSVAGRVACVTGASSGIGEAIAVALAAAGARVVGIARRAEAMAAWVGGAEGRAHALRGDLERLETIPALAAAAAAPFGPPDIVVNAAGINLRQSAEAIDAEGWRRTLDLNLAAPFFLAQALVPAMRAKGWGRVLNIASLQSFRAFPDGLAYGASKGGVAQMTRAMAQAWSPHGICCNALAPGFFPTELTGPVFADPALAARNAAQTCMGRNGALADLLGPALFLCAPASDYVTGQILAVDGGFTAR